MPRAKINRDEPAEGVLLTELSIERLKQLAARVNHELMHRNMQRDNARKAKHRYKQGKINPCIAVKLDPDRISSQDRLAQLIDDQRRDKKWGHFDDALTVTRKKRTRDDFKSPIDNQLRKDRLT